MTVPFRILHQIYRDMPCFIGAWSPRETSRCIVRQIPELGTMYSPAHGCVGCLIYRHGATRAYVAPVKRL